jgi:2'-5' RNA ligase
MPRYFLAVTPPEPQWSRIEALRVRWGSPHHAVEPHITVKIPFAWAPAPSAFLDPLRAVCAAHRPFAATLGAPARFAGGQVLYLTVESPELPAFHRAVAGALTAVAPLDSRGHEGEAYTPHLTLAVGRFGIDPAGLDAMEREATAELTGLPAFPVTSLRCYRRAGTNNRWQPLIDLPLGF